MTDLQSLFLRGLASFKRTPKETLQEVANYVKQGGVIVYSEKGKPTAFCIIHWPSSTLDLPQIMHFYSEGSRHGTRLLISSVLDKIKQKGYSRFHAVNGSGADDKVWTRAFRAKGWEIKAVKTVFEFEVK